VRQLIGCGAGFRRTLSSDAATWCERHRHDGAEHIFESGEETVKGPIEDGTLAFATGMTAEGPIEEHRAVEIEEILVG